jgi:hypothetical protein
MGVGKCVRPGLGFWVVLATNLKVSIAPLGEARTWIWGQTLSDRIARGINRLFSWFSP